MDAVDIHVILTENNVTGGWAGGGPLQVEPRLNLG